MGAMVPFETAGLPAHIAALQGVSGDDLTAGTGGGFPVISIKGKVFHIVRGDDRMLVTRADGSGEPASSIEVVIIRANPALSKSYYATGYVDGSEDKPTCYSEDGIEPAADSLEKQATKCAGCHHNQWGSKVTENSTKAKACADVRRLAVAPVGTVNDPMLLRIPAASLKPLGQYGDMLKKRGVAYPSVATKISFDFTVSHPQLTFAPVSFISEDMAAEVQRQMNSDIVLKIIGMGGGHAASQSAQPKPALAAPKPAPEAPAPKPAVAKQPAAAPKKPAATAASAFSSAPVAPAASAPKPTPAKQPTVVVDTSSLDADLDKVLSEAGFDDK